MYYDLVLQNALKNTQINNQKCTKVPPKKAFLMGTFPVVIWGVMGAFVPMSPTEEAWSHQKGPGHDLT